MDSSYISFLKAAAAALLVLLLNPFPSILVAESATIINSSDQEALLSFRALISDPSHSLPSWNGNSTVCQWSGVSCDGSNPQRVVGLDLHGLGLKGSISPWLGNLSSLRFLYLQDNRLSGPLPTQIGGLVQLQILNASSNLIQGPIPPNITMCSQLKQLDLSANSVSGSIPSELERLQYLQVLKLGRNQLLGPIPPSLGNLSSLTTLDLGTNNLSGPIPSDLGRLRNLQGLLITLNNLTGTVPASLYNVSSLVNFNLASNNLWGELPADVGFMLPNLLVFHVCYNGFTGPIPPSLNNITMIQSIRMSHNYLTGTVPPGLGNLPHLIMYNIGFNNILTPQSGGLDFITSLTNSTKLVFLAIDGNSLQGVIPESVGNLSTALSKLYMGGNRIYGSIPGSIGLLTGLTLLNMSQNSIHGEIPPSIGQLKGLRMLGLAGNKISGTIPDSLGNLTKLTKLELYRNDLEGKIPFTFVNYKQIESLDISSNKLNGVIPIEIFTLTSLTSVLNLSKNSLTGPLPQGIGRLTNLVAIDLSGNLLSGDIPNSIEYCTSLQYLSMSNNSLSGEIPDRIGNMKGLQTIDISSNQLSGTIPDALGQLQDLQFLNLSYNNLQGKIPSFQSHPRVYFEGNPNLCTSLFCTKDPPNSSHLIVIIIATLALCLLLSGLLATWFARKRKTQARDQDIEESIKGKHRKVSYEELVRATAGFHPTNLIGSGSFGSVYKGVLSDGIAVAIKVMNLAKGGASKSFVAECEALRHAKHRNLVKLVTLCSSWDATNGEFLALVYELMGNGSLEDWIRGERCHENGEGLSVVERLEVAIGVASAIDYLHNNCEEQVVHCDLKPSNVMLDGELNAKVGDFGLARLMVVEAGGKEGSATESTTIAIKGSIGYIPPEYGFGGKPTTRGDVYSYGVMLLELLTAKSPVAADFEGDLSLEKWVRDAFPTRTEQVLDVELLSLATKASPFAQEKLDKCLVSMLGVGLACTVGTPEGRITMREALHHLNAISDSLMRPPLKIPNN